MPVDIRELTFENMSIWPASIKAAATLSAKMSKHICALMGEDGDSLSACMSARKDKIKASFNAYIDAAFTASVTTDND